MTTPLVYGLLAYAAAVARIPLAILVGAGFGLGRSRPIMTGLRAPDGTTAAELARRFAHLTRTDVAFAVVLAVVMSGSVVLWTS
jgi:hypothetical protein